MRQFDRFGPVPFFFLSLALAIGCQGEGRGRPDGGGDAGDFDAGDADSGDGDASAEDSGAPDGSPSDPSLTAIVPSAVDVMLSGGTAILRVGLDRPAPVGGAIVQLASSSPTYLAVPPSVTIPEGRTSVGFRVRADATYPNGPWTITATLSGTASQVTAIATIVGFAPAPSPTSLVVNEILYNVPLSGNGDANCDGSTDTVEDEFIELTNVSTGPLRLDDVSIFASYTPTPRFSFTGFDLGPGESVVVFGGGPLSPSGIAPWCDIVSTTHINGTIAFYALNGFYFTEGYTVHVTVGPSLASADAAAPVVLADVGYEAYARSPDFTGGFVGFTAAGGATDRNWSPGTFITGEWFFRASP